MINSLRVLEPVCLSVYFCTSNFIDSSFFPLFFEIFRAAYGLSKIYQPIFMCVFANSLLTTSCAMLIIQLESVEYLHSTHKTIWPITYSIIHNFQSHHGNHSTELFLLEISACVTFVGLFISCELSQRLSNSFSEINDMIGRFQWYRFPTEVKRILPMTLIFVQKPASLQCFGSFTCCRDAFKKVIKCEIENSYANIL